MTILTTLYWGLLSYTKKAFLKKRLFVLICYLYFIITQAFSVLWSKAENKWKGYHVHTSATSTRWQCCLMKTDPEIFNFAFLTKIKNVFQKLYCIWLPRVLHDVNHLGFVMGHYWIWGLKGIFYFWAWSYTQSYSKIWKHLISAALGSRCLLVIVRAFPSCRCSRTYFDSQRCSA